MEWVHKCSLEWLKKRQGFLTASDIKRLVPVTKTGRPRKVTEIDMLKVAASKCITLTEDDCMSYGAAARGHILEPYAVEAFNETGWSHRCLYHWDDQLITRPGLFLGYSPDAMDIVPDERFALNDIHEVAEIKCYSDEKHIITACTPKAELEERWQIATAMAVLQNVYIAHLVLFNPRMEEQRLVAFSFERCELKEEIEMVLDVEDEWVKFCGSNPYFLPPNIMCMNCGESEKAIMEKISKRQRLNP